MKGKKRKKNSFLSFLFELEREREREREEKIKPSLSSIYRVSSIGIRRAKNESSSTRRGLCVGTENMGFHRGFK